MASIERLRQRFAILIGSHYAFFAFLLGAIFATARFPGTVPGIFRGYFFGGPAGALGRLTQDSQGLDWLIAWLIYPAIGAVLGGFKRLFRPTSVPRWMFWTTVVLAALFSAETIVLSIRHTR